MITNKLKLTDNILPKEYQNIDFSAINKTLEDASKKLALKKEQIIKDRCVALGIEYDLDKEYKKRFRSFIIEVRGSKETLYYNDGTDEGIRIVTFELETTDKYSIANSRYEFNTNLKYY